MKHKESATMIVPMSREQHTKVRRAARKTGRSMAAVMRVLIDHLEVGAPDVRSGPIPPKDDDIV